MIRGYVLLHEAEDNQNGNFKVIIPLVVSDSHPDFHKPEDTAEFVKKCKPLLSVVALDDNADPIDLALNMDDIAEGLSILMQHDPENFGVNTKKFFEQIAKIAKTVLDE